MAATAVAARMTRESVGVGGGGGTSLARVGAKMT